MTGILDAAGGDLLSLAERLVRIPSVSFEERALADHVEQWLAAKPALLVDRVGDNVVARTQFGRAARVVLAGHLDTVPPAEAGDVRREPDQLWGVGAADMKGGLAVMLALADLTELTGSEGLAVDVTWVFYAREEVAAEHNGLGELVAKRPELLAGDVAVIGEPTSGSIEAGCQGTMRLQVELQGVRAHTARAWMGRNALHRLGPLLCALDRYEGRRPVVDGCEFREAIQAVAVTGGVSGNVVPDRVELTVNHRYAPDRDSTAAEAHVREVLAPHLGEGDRVEVVEAVDGARPAVDSPLLAGLISRNGLAVAAKLGWTDVARFATLGVPAVNFGPGDSLLAHQRDERLDRAPLERVHRVLTDLLRTG